jgi:hypothetical protein
MHCAARPGPPAGLRCANGGQTDAAVAPEVLWRLRDGYSRPCPVSLNSRTHKLGRHAALRHMQKSPMLLRTRTATWTVPPPPDRQEGGTWGPLRPSTENPETQVGVIGGPAMSTQGYAEEAPPPDSSLWHPKGTRPRVRALRSPTASRSSHAPPWPMRLVWGVRGRSHQTSATLLLIVRLAWSMGTRVEEQASTNELGRLSPFRR